MARECYFFAGPPVQFADEEPRPFVRRKPCIRLQSSHCSAWACSNSWTCSRICCRSWRGSTPRWRWCWASPARLPPTTRSLGGSARRSAITGWVSGQPASPSQGSRACGGLCSIWPAPAKVTRPRSAIASGPAWPPSSPLHPPTEALSTARALPARSAPRDPVVRSAREHRIRGAGVSDDDLETVPVAGNEATLTSRRRLRRRWPWALGGSLALVIALVFPVRTALAHAEVDRLERDWAVLVALDASRESLVNRLVSESVPTDTTVVRQATIALDEEEATRVTALRRSLPANRLDHGASALRGAIATAFDREVAGLDTSIASLKRGETFLPSQLYAASVDFGTVQAQIDAQRRRFGEDLHDQHQSSATLHAADAALAAFSHFADSQTGARLLVTTNFGVRVLDVDRSTDSAVDLG